MNLSQRRVGIGALALGLLVAGGLVLNANSVWSCDGSKTTTASKVENSSSAVKPVSNSGCPMAKGGACSAKMKDMAGCCAMGKTTTAASCPAGAMFPEGTTVTRTEVEGGVDLVFVGNDLKAIKSALQDHIKACDKDKACGNQKCTVTLNKKEKNVVLAIRGDNPDQCCAGLMMTASDESSAPMACPHATKEGAQKTEVKKL